MNYLDFIELSSFRRSWQDMGLGDEELAELQKQIMQDPEAGNQIGDLRKIRVSLKGQGKSGGARVILVYVQMKHLVFLLYSYPKSKKENFTASEKKTLKDVSALLMKEAMSDDFMTKKELKHDR